MNEHGEKLYREDLLDELRAVAGWETLDMDHPGPFVLPFGTSLIIEAAATLIESQAAHIEAVRYAAVMVRMAATARSSSRKEQIVRVERLLAAIEAEQT